MSKKQIIIFTDLDGTLLDVDTFKLDIIEDYFKKLISNGIIIIPNSSKTESELLDFNRQYNIKLSFISENGSSIHGLNLLHKNLPDKFVISKYSSEILNIYKKKTPFDLQEKVTFISSLNSKEQEKIFGLPNDKLLLANQRMHSIPILFNGTKNEKIIFTKTIDKIGLSIQSGGRIMNICDKTDKSNAMIKTLEIIKKQIKREIITIGVGDNLNDIEMIKNSDFPCLVKNKNFDNSMINIGNLIMSTEPSPKGWADVIKMALQKI